jgi:hypothetical protein
MGASASVPQITTVAAAHDKAVSAAHIGSDADPTAAAPTFTVGLSATHVYPAPREGVHPDVATFPPALVLRLDRECLTLLRTSENGRIDRLLCQWNYHDIMCWGHTSDAFQFRVFDQTLNADAGEKAVFVLKTRHGVPIEAAIMATVLALMARTKREALDESEMNELIATIRDDESYDALRKVATLRSISAQQALRLIRLAGDDEFEKVECCVICYEQLLNKSSLQLLLGEFPDAAARENVLVRLGVPHDGLVVSTSASVPTPQLR